MADQGNEGLLSKWLRGKRMGAAARHLSGRVLDYGCGSGSLAAMVDSGRYFGVDRDQQSLQIARTSFPDHKFSVEPPAAQEKFDTVVSLAVIEHVGDPVQFLANLAAYLSDRSGSRLVLTTPHPALEWAHDAGAAVGLFSRHANEEHEDLLDRGKLESVGKRCGLRLQHYNRFLWGANQLAVYTKEQP